MKLPAKPKSSPIRTTTTADEIAPPLIMFPRSKSTRATTRSRANPMFVRKIKFNNGNEEPSSPKVTCIGQVRVKRSNKKQTKTTSAYVRRSQLFRKIKQFRRVWRGRISCFRCDCFRKSAKVQESTDTQTKREIGDVIGACNDELIAESTPRDAVLLTRSRSAPNRINGDGDEMRKKVSEKIVVKEENEGVNEEDEDSINGDEEFKAKVKVKPVNLSRCKSEPARTGDKLFMSFSFSV